MRGQISLTAGGGGFVTPDNQREGRVTKIYIPRDRLNGAMHGDQVEVDGCRRTARGPEGEVVRVLRRGQSHIVGRLRPGKRRAWIVAPFDRRAGYEILVAPDAAGSVSDGDMVVVELTTWPSAERGAEGRVVEVLGPPDAPGVDVNVIMRTRGIPDAHAADALAEASQMGDGVRETECAGRTDFRHVPTVTIDGEHARDFDDAVSIEALVGGRFRLSVHIADVSHYVKEGSALDRDAYLRGTSVYFPERAIHMFPTALATGLCSLNPHVDRLVQSCVMDIDREGAVLSYEMHDAVIKSDARLTYTDVNVILSDRLSEVMAQFASFVPMLEAMHKLFDVLNGRRRRRGAVDFDLPETEVILSEFGEIEAIVPSERNVAHRIIEEFMLLANETVAAHLVACGMPALHRVHEAPDPLKVAKFEAFIATLGYGLGSVGGQVSSKDFQLLVDRIHGCPEERPIAALMLRTMQKARYDSSSLGHFGLAAEAYTHFTSPIRRYPDLVVHRRLRESRRGALNAGSRRALSGGLAEVAAHTSETERRADDAERALLHWKKVRYMADKIGDEYDGFVSGVAPFGLFVGLAEPFVEGLVPIASMADDYYQFNEELHMLSGERTGKRYRLGQGVRVQVVRADIDARQIDFAVLEILDALRLSPGTRKRASGGKPAPRARTMHPGRRERAARGSQAKKRRTR